MTEKMLITIAADTTAKQAAGIIAAAPPSAKLRGNADGTVSLIVGRNNDTSEDEQ